MENAVSVAIISGIVSLIVGTTASLIAPWVQYYIKRREASLNHQMSIISEARKWIEDCDSELQLYECPHTEMIKQNLNDKELEEVYSGSLIMDIHIPNADLIHRKSTIFRAIHRQEVKWKLRAN